MKTVSALTVRKKFGSILDQVAKGEPIAITRANEPLVVMEPYAEYQAREDRQTRRARLEESARRMDAWVERNAKYLKKGPDAVTLIRRLRDSR
ncbi:MAG: type II toxin-antitoxin system Phd/YefM family antitoxin [Candidatus Omnitrophica bacterium]|nr:type II toxin-antitoxin system Phd/YefM family antitoxin [Candidatus Omnitrophota bacterium]